ncbi:hypothetical protein PCASD_01276 [Puccinia coronata f. sp. avenae]|uniref:Uncharacterized protein n=1 Tax=Puccinia coronata f. sp. avenae TaxID=200324 RepID=A0A2N5VJ64_9BASI|nr:hypothetical protein PCASD_01276 [Puccinia coronata f. sp. avenae]
MDSFSGSKLVVRIPSWMWCLSVRRGIHDLGVLFRNRHEIKEIIDIFRGSELNNASRVRAPQGLLRSPPVGKGLMFSLSHPTPNISNSCDRNHTDILRSIINTTRQNRVLGHSVKETEPCPHWPRIKMLDGATQGSG